MQIYSYYLLYPSKTPTIFIFSECLSHNYAGFYLVFNLQPIATTPRLTAKKSEKEEKKHNKSTVQPL